MATNYQFCLATDAAQTQYNGLGLTFQPLIDFTDPPQVGCYVTFGTTEPTKWFVVTSKEYIFQAAGATTVQYNLDVFQPAGG